MEAFKTHTGIVAPLDRANIDTDAIIPKQFLKRIKRSGYGQFLFYDWRFDKNEHENPDFLLNREPYRNATVLLTRDNFGCGSSREHAPWAIDDFGFRAVIAPSFADIFYNNCFKNGILPIQLPAEDVQQLFEKASVPGYQLTVNLEKNFIADGQGYEKDFEVDDYRRNMLLNGLDEISATIQYDAEITDFEKNHKIHYSL
ncbi:3-isopropylmalate/(R)-2-methylmalate dehydratase small subunit [Planomicrobium stackebrandtii]|uniref:3-isopropylmalate dehydratase small subunit n=1 Tax=Planomicrobium stackebrandtii TaxID=253160 RepID=A0ABU0GW10_9BACL|nr:3-isopropylmalate dehydratase small subunit [Planomicrobium stackebrandtii]MDQ0429508.1 3-isopropylmalate/(R)-2-methylmalate dehydratase small subunit [Planomicrobium stackebrandtii]